jgi:hypothetical protein
VQISMFSRPVPVNGPGEEQHNNAGSAAFDSAGNGNWTIAGVGGSNSGANTDALFVRATPQCMFSAQGVNVQPAGSTMACTTGSSTWGVGGSDSTYSSSISDWQFTLTASGTGSTTSMNICLTTNGVTCATDEETISITSSAAPYTYPTTGVASGGVITTPGFPSTQYGTGANAAPFGYWFANQVNNLLTRPDLQPHTGVVTVSGSTATWVSGETFRPSSMTAGSYITLGGTDYKIASVASPLSITLTSPPAGGTYNYLYQQVGLLVSKASAVTGTLTVSSVSNNDWEEANFTMPISGLWDVCAYTTVTDSSGNVYEVCTAQEGTNHPIYAINIATGASHFIGLAEPSNNNGGSCLTGNCAQGVTGNHLNDYGNPGSQGIGSIFISPTTVILDALDASSNRILVSGTYNPSGSGSCPNNWQEITLANCSTYPVNNNFVWWNVTPKVGSDGMDHTPITGANAFATANSLNGWYPSQLNSYPGNGAIDPYTGWVSIFWSMAGQQDYPGWLELLNPASNYSVVALIDTYQHEGCRFCGLHNEYSLNNLVNISSSADGEPAFPVCSNIGCGPFVLQTTTSTDNMTENTCSGITDPNWTSFNGSVRCFDLTLSGTDPCHTTPGASEVAPMFGTCSWNGSYVNLSGVTVAVGDLLGDPSWYGSPGTGEMFRVVAIPSAGVIRVLRAYATPSVTYGSGAPSSTLTAHTGPWLLYELCSASAGQNGGWAWFNVSTDPTGATPLVDYPGYLSAHVGYSLSGVTEEVNRVRSAYTPLVNTINQPFTFSFTPSGPFNSTSGGATSCCVQSHGATSMDQYNPYYSVDANPYSEVSTASNTLWSQTATNVTGSLWKIAAANVQLYSGTTWPAAIKSLPLNRWVGQYMLQDISGPSSSIGGTSTDYYHFCVAYLAGECYSGSSAGDVFMNAPQMAENGVCGPWDYVRNPCFTTLGPIVTGVSQWNFTGISSGSITDGSLFRRLTSGFQRNNQQSVYTSVHGEATGRYIFFQSDGYAGGLRTDSFLIKLPPLTSRLLRNGFVNVSVTVTSGQNPSMWPNARLSFGYAEHSIPNGGTCSVGVQMGAQCWLATSRRDNAYTEPSPTSTSPFYYGSDTGQSYVSCASGCTLTLPVVSGQVAAYTIQLLDSGGTVQSTLGPYLGYDSALTPGVGTVAGSVSSGNSVSNGASVRP